MRKILLHLLQCIFYRCFILLFYVIYESFVYIYCPHSCITSLLIFLCFSLLAFITGSVGCKSPISFCIFCLTLLTLSSFPEFAFIFSQSIHGSSTIPPNCFNHNS